MKTIEILGYPCKIQDPSAVALGRFDGVHLAHQKVIANSKRENLVSVVFTFCDNPGKADSKLITTEKEKQALMENCKADILVNATFESVRNMSAEEFVRDVLCNCLNAKVISCGYNYRFSKGAAADVNTLRSLCEKYSITLVCSEELIIDNITVSSTAIRNLLAEGNISLVNKLLGRAYSLEGKIIHGNAIGRTINTPTLNIDVEETKLLPLYGVYATRAYIGGRWFPSVTNIGVKPTVGSVSPTVETYLLDFDGDFYGDYCRIELVDFIREEEKFSDLSALKEAIAKDIEKAKLLLT